MRRYLPAEIQPVIDFWMRRQPAFLWAPTSPDTWLKDRAKGLTARAVNQGGAIQAGGVPNPKANGDGYITFPTNCGIGAGNSVDACFLGVALVEVVDPTALTGSFLKIGNGSTGLGFGAGNTTFEDVGGSIIALQEAVAWRVGSSSAFARGINVCTFGATAEGGAGSAGNVLAHTNVTTNLEYSGANSTSTIAPSSDLQIQGYTTSRTSNARVLAAAIYKKDLNNAAFVAERMLLASAAAQFARQRNSERLFSPRRPWLPVTVAGAAITGPLIGSRHLATNGPLISGRLAA